MKLRELDLPNDYEGIAALLNLIEPVSSSAESVASNSMHMYLI